MRKEELRRALVAWIVSGWFKDGLLVPVGRTSIQGGFRLLSRAVWNEINGLEVGFIGKLESHHASQGQ